MWNTALHLFNLQENGDAELFWTSGEMQIASDVTFSKFGGFIIQSHVGKRNRYYLERRGHLQTDAKRLYL